MVEKTHKPRTVFWSWQSDYSPKTCRFFVRDALQDAIQQLSEEMSLNDADRPELDHDTKGERGMVNISEAILAKIEKASLFVADVTPVAITKEGKRVPNPNVMIELGWAMHRPGVERVIPVLNTASGAKIEDLPFDIRGRRVVAYHLDESGESAIRKEESKKLTDLLRNAMRDELAQPATLEVPEIVGVEAHSRDPSRWASKDGCIDHNEHFGSVRVFIGDGPKAYLRVIPASHAGDMPDIVTVKNHSEASLVRPGTQGRASAGSFGSTEEGYVWYWFIPGSEARYARNLTMYFESTGELWMFNEGVFWMGEAHPMLDLPEMGREWWRLLHAAMVLLDGLGLPSARRVEVGFFADKKPCLPVNYGQPHQSRNNQFSRAMTLPAWNERDMESLLVSALNGVRSLFELEKLDHESACRIMSTGK